MEAVVVALLLLLAPLLIAFWRRQEARESALSPAEGCGGCTGCSGRATSCSTGSRRSPR